MLGLYFAYFPKVGPLREQVDLLQLPPCSDRRIGKSYAEYFARCEVSARGGIS
jgi:hypothetical protein